MIGDNRLLSVPHALTCCICSKYLRVREVAVDVVGTGCVSHLDSGLNSVLCVSRQRLNGEHDFCIVNGRGINKLCIVIAPCHWAILHIETETLDYLWKLRNLHGCMYVRTGQDKISIADNK